MNCPNCGEVLREKERSGIEVDVCPVCRGVWLDRGELDKIIDRESRYTDEDDDDWSDGRRDRDRDGGRDRDSRGQKQPAKKKGFFQTLMENVTEGGEGGMD